MRCDDGNDRSVSIGVDIVERCRHRSYREMGSRLVANKARPKYTTRFPVPASSFFPSLTSPYFTSYIPKKPRQRILTCLHSFHAVRSMHSFVVKRTDPPSRPQSASSKRRVAGDNARVSTPATRLQHDQTQESLLSIRQLKQNSNPQGWPNPGQRRDSGETINGKNDRFGTDAGSSIDTTVNDQSELLHNSQHFEQQESYHQGNSQGYDSDSGSDDQSSGEGEDHESGGDGEFYEEQKHQNQIVGEERAEVQRRLVEGLSNLEGISYPSTTSGPPDDLSYQNSLGQQHPTESADYIDPSGALNHQRYEAYSSGPAPLLKRTDNPGSNKSTMPTLNTIQKSNIIRETDQRAREDLNRRGESVQQVVTAPTMPDRSASKIAIQASRAAVVQHRAVTKGPQVSQAAVQSTSGPAYATATKAVYVSPGTPNQPLLLPRPQTHPQPQEELIDRYHSTEEDSVPEFEGPSEDYDAPVLFDMSYEQLHKEDFDHEPRGTNRVLSADMQSRSLIERLVHVQNKCNPVDQSQFFRALPTREWEDAGDWFLDQFSRVIDRAKEVRQKKRKIARDFEDKVQGRYTQVAKRQRNVEDALGEMKEKGQGLIPKSPRASKEPVAKGSNP